MKTKIGLPLGLALVMFIGVFTMMLALGVMSPSKAQAVNDGFDVTLSNPAPGVETGVEFTVTSTLRFTGALADDPANTGNIKTTDTLTITFPTGFTTTGGAVGAPANWTLAGEAAAAVDNSTNGTVILTPASVAAVGQNPAIEIDIAANGPIAVVFTDPAGSVGAQIGILTPAGLPTGLPQSYQLTAQTSPEAAATNPVIPAGESALFIVNKVPTPVGGLTVTNSPQSPGAVAQYVISFTTTGTGQLNANSGTITVHFDKDFAGLGPLSKDHVVISASQVITGGTAAAGGSAVNPPVDPVRRVVEDAPNVGNVEYTITVPDMNGSEDGVPNIAPSVAGTPTVVNVTISPGAGISNPTEAADDADDGGGKGPIGIFTSADTEPSFENDVFVPRQLFLDDYDNNRNKAITVIGKGYKDGTTATVWLDNNGDGTIDGDETTLIQVPIASDDTFEATLTVTVPPFNPGRGNQINATDGRDWTPTTDLPTFEVQGLMTVNPKTVGPGDEIQVSLVDWASGGTGGAPVLLARGPANATITIGGIDHSMGITFDDGVADFSLVIANRIPLGSQRMDLSAAGEADDTNLTISGSTVVVTPETVVANQTLSVSGRGFSGAGASINGNVAQESVGNQRISSVTFGGSAIDLKAATDDLNTTQVDERAPSDKINGGQSIDIDNGGNWSASIVVPITDASTTAGVQQLKIIDSQGREGIANVTVAQRSVTLSPSVSRPGTTVEITGAGYPANNSNRGSDPVVLVTIRYGNRTVATVTPDTSGNFTTSFRVPLTSGIPSTNTIEIEFDADNLASPSRDFEIHDVPGATITLSADEGMPGDTLTVSGEGFNAYNSLETLTVGPLEVTPSPNPSTTATGTFQTNFLVPELDTGIQTVEVEVGGTVASASFRITEAATTPTMTPEAEAAAPAMAFAEVTAEDNLITVYHFDPATQSEAPNFGWTLYDARPLFMGGNNLDMVNPGGFYFVEVSENQMGVTLGGRTMDLYAGLNPIVW